jgi:asparagine synthase (glutamine-hydrolysing)
MIFERFLRDGRLSHHRACQSKAHPIDASITVFLDGPAWPLPGLGYNAFGGEVGHSVEKPIDMLTWIHQAYKQWGISFISRLGGEFAIVIDDARNQQVYLIRDHLGTRPLYWARTSTELWVSSAIEPLAKGIGASLCEHTIARHLYAPWAPVRDSFFKDIFSVRPGQYMRFSPKRHSAHQWWDPRAIQEQAYGDPKEVCQSVRQHTLQAITQRLPPNSAIGTHLSGGIDSSLVTQLACQALQQTGRTVKACYTWSPPFKKNYPDLGLFDERHRIRELSDRLAIVLRFGGATSQGIEALIAQPMEFQGVADVLDELGTIEQAASDGIGVMLSGWGGDECLSNHGHGHLSGLLGQGQWRPLLRRARNQTAGFRLRPFLQVLWRQGMIPRLPEALYAGTQPTTTLYPESAFPSPHLMRLYQELAPMPSLRLKPDAKDFLCQLLLYGHLEERMRTWFAWSAPRGLEYRYPLLDRCLLELILSLPAPLLFGEGEPRHLIRCAFKDQLPLRPTKREAVCERMHDHKRLLWWQMLKRVEAEGQLDGTCPWLDMAQLREVIRQTPLPIRGDRTGAQPNKRLRWIQTVARMRVAMRVWGMYQRHAQ